MSARRGAALLAALWLVILVAGAGLQLATVSRERRALGLGAADRARATYALQGAMARVQAQLETRLRGAPGRTRERGASALATDPWRDLPSDLASPIVQGDVSVDARFTDLGTVVNLNSASEQ